MCTVRVHLACHRAPCKPIQHLATLNWLCATGEGTYGLVYHARSKETGGRYAIKQFKGGRVRGRGALCVFLDGCWRAGGDGVCVRPTRSRSLRTAVMGACGCLDGVRHLGGT